MVRLVLSLGAAVWLLFWEDEPLLVEGCLEACLFGGNYNAQFWRFFFGNHGVACGIRALSMVFVSIWLERSDWSL